MHYLRCTRNSLFIKFVHTLGKSCNKVDACAYVYNTKMREGEELAPIWKFPRGKAAEFVNFQGCGTKLL